MEHTRQETVKLKQEVGETHRDADRQNPGKTGRRERGACLGKHAATPGDETDFTGRHNTGDDGEDTRRQDQEIEIQITKLGTSHTEKTIMT